MSAVMSASPLLFVAVGTCKDIGGGDICSATEWKGREGKTERSCRFQRAIGEEIIHSTAGFYHAGVKGQNSVSLWSAEEIKYSSDLETSSHRAPRYRHQNSLAVLNISNVPQDLIWAFFFFFSFLHLPGLIDMHRGSTLIIACWAPDQFCNLLSKLNDVMCVQALSDLKEEKEREREKSYNRQGRGRRWKQKGAAFFSMSVLTYHVPWLCSLGSSLSYTQWSHNGSSNRNNVRAELKPDRSQHTVISDAGYSRSCIVSCLVQVWLFLNVVHLDRSHRHYCYWQK